MIDGRVWRLAGWLLVVLLGAGAVAAYATGNTVPASNADDNTIPITANALRPAACAALNLTNVVVGSGAFDGTVGNDLILGSPGNDSIRGRQGTDCILAGDGADSIQGNQGGDVILAGNGDDALTGDQGTDVCDGEGGTDTGDPSCETSLNIP